MNPWHDVDPGKRAPEIIDCIIEVPRGSRNKYELDKKTGLLRLDRVLYSAVFYPANYGFIPRTYCDDHDPLDILVLGQEQVVPMCILTARPIGMMQMVDQNEEDDKIIAIHENDPAVAHFRDISALPAHTLDELQRFFEDYKILEHKKVRIERFLGRIDALNIIAKSLRLYTDSFNPDGSKRPDAPLLQSELRAYENTSGHAPSRSARIDAARRHAAGLDGYRAPEEENSDSREFIAAPFVDPPFDDAPEDAPEPEAVETKSSIADSGMEAIQFDFQTLDVHAPRGQRSTNDAALDSAETPVDGSAPPIQSNGGSTAPKAQAEEEATMIVNPAAESDPDQAHNNGAHSNGQS